MANKKPETNIVDGIIDWIKEQGGDAYKTLGSAAQRGGEPDVTGEIYVPEMEAWVHLKLEVKTDEGEATKRQEMRIDLYSKRGYVAGIVRSIEDVQTLIGQYVTEWRVRNAEHLEWKAQLEKQAENNVDGVFATEIKQERDDLLTAANVLNAQLESERHDYNLVATENAQLRAWIDRFYRTTQWVDVEGLKREVKKTLDWL